MKLLVQPGDGTAPLVRAIHRAKKCVEVVIFRFDCFDIERALEQAMERGVAVQALIAFTNRGGEKNLRQLETRLLGRGITVTRTADDLVRYHGKMLLIDRAELWLMAFNFTHLDIDQSRSFALMTKDRSLVHEAGRLFDCDTKRQPYTEGNSRFIVSPVNARERLDEFIHGAKKQLLIYDVEIADRAILRRLAERQAAGVEIRVIGEVKGKTAKLDVRALSHLRLHTRAIIRDRRDLFLGSQSLRPLELDSRREIGVIVHAPTIAATVIKRFEEDWKQSEKDQSSSQEEKELDPTRALKKMAKVISKNLPGAPTLAKAVKQAIAEQTTGPIDDEEVQDTVRIAVKEAVRDVVKHVVENVVEQEVGGKSDDDAA